MDPRILVVDDERLAREKIVRYLREFPQTFILEQAKNGLEALEKIASFAPDIVFLDVEMPGLTGFDVLRQLPTVPFQVIFETAFDEFAIRAFEESACDYLLKPFTSERLYKALTRALSRTTRPAAPRGTSFLERITVRRGRELIVLRVEEIHCFLSRDHYTCVMTDAAEYLIELSLSHLEAHLDPGVFRRLHRNALVRSDTIRSITSGPNMKVTLESGLELRVSRAHRGELGKL